MHLHRPCQRLFTSGREADRPLAMIIGIGNYTFPQTRHSAGMMLVDFLAHHWAVQMQSVPPLRATIGMAYPAFVFRDAQTGEKRRHVVPLFLAKPQLFMNESGVGVRHLRSFFAISYNLEKVLIA